MFAQPKPAEEKAPGVSGYLLPLAATCIGTNDRVPLDGYAALRAMHIASPNSITICSLLSAMVVFYLNLYLRAAPRSEEPGVVEPTQAGRLSLWYCPKTHCPPTTLCCRRCAFLPRRE